MLPRPTYISIVFILPSFSSQWCGTTSEYCGTCCQSGPCTSPPSSPPPPLPSPPYSAAHGEDSRLVAYVGNWQTCPTIKQYDAYSHIVIAFAVSYTWSPAKNVCNLQCNIDSTVPICNNANNQGLINTLRAAGKKVIVSFGGAGMGGSWTGKALRHCVSNDNERNVANSWSLQLFFLHRRSK
jgi:hypothetical protein